ncbi:hypothetical protein SEA_SLOOPYJOE_65 [Arthrobacter phage Sloopyjoe]|nr:hypothetical protein PBI_STAYER_65 [Arthrobacter phage Stayer]QFG09770.1 hypothetical protein PBI_SHIBA_64 [Arthrobacter phage Shiba]QFG10207.1 hypothetical protein PBI_EGAD_65 [Arthrobacter phage Egad]QFG11776.1 hypothetical protein PBI_SALK_65 [Arthrobacter phage Salk]QFG12659.1 hypothetical protein PBI_MICHELLE_65 [Arthrobacter phage Michelle]QFG14432.1 hypothetical protein PBI_STARLORD_65 [Arthrobacter phage StarLord]UVT31141.1 hypothetical protein PBI_LINDA_65 [Arthrobacter phage Lind
MAHKLGGHPDPEIQKLFRTLKNTVELTASLQDKVPAGTYEVLKASCLGMMEVYAVATNRPSPIGAIIDDWEGRLKELGIDIDG